MNDETELCVPKDEKRDDELLSPCPQRPGRAIITLDGLVHERNGYAGMSRDTRAHEIQADSIRFTTTTCIHMFLPGK